MNEPKITVIIPTRERCDVLEKSLQTVTAQNYDNLEIIVSDNFSCDATEQIVRSADDTRVKYINTGQRVSMSHNWEFALSHVTEGWVTILGDDDGLFPASLNKVADIIQSTDIQAIRSSACCLYAWPSLTGKDFGRLTISLKSGCEVRDSKGWLLKVMNGHAHYHELPILYTGGFVSMPVLQEMKRKAGAFYYSCTPDIYSAVAISSVIKSYVYSNEPFAINGLSRHSTGTAAFAIGEKSELSPMQKFRSEENIPFHKDIPLFDDGNYPPSEQAFVYESYLQSAFLRDDVRQCMHQQQLELILATSGKHSVSIGEWGKIFAATHGLDYDEIQHRATRRKLLLFLRLTSVPGRIFSAFNRYDVGSPELPIKDVYEASIAAAALRSLMPSRLNKLHRLVGRALEKLIGAIFTH